MKYHIPVFIQQRGSSFGHIISLRVAVRIQEQYRASHAISPKIEQVFSLLHPWCYKQNIFSASSCHPGQHVTFSHNAVTENIQQRLQGKPTPFGSLAVLQSRLYWDEPLVTNQAEQFRQLGSDLRTHKEGHFLLMMICNFCLTFFDPSQLQHLHNKTKPQPKWVSFFKWQNKMTSML